MKTFDVDLKDVGDNYLDSVYEDILSFVVGFVALGLFLVLVKVFGGVILGIFGA